MPFYPERITNRRRRTAPWQSAALLAGLLAVVLLMAAAGCTSDPSEPRPSPSSALAAADSPDSIRRVSQLDDALPEPSKPVLVIHDSTDTYGQNAFEQTTQTLQYAKQPFDVYNIALPSAGSSNGAAAAPAAAPPALPPLNRYSAVLTATGFLWKLSGAEATRLRRYVEDGGGLAVLYRSWHDSLSAPFGAPGDSEPPFEESRERVSFEREVMPGLRGLTLPTRFLTFYDFVPDPGQATPIARADSSGRPLVWRRRHGQGRVVYWNNTLLSDKSYRGLINQSLALVRPRTVRPMANWGAFFLDDFPAPAPGTKVEPIRSELDLSPAAFYGLRWYPDMKELSEEFGVRYTSAVVFSYNNYVRPPFRFRGWVGARIRPDERPVHYAPWVSREAVRDTEVALHGYNHQSLSLKYWPDQASMTRGLRRGLKRWLVDTGGKQMNPTVYVPPMNVIDSTGVAALQEAVPSIDVIAGFYSETFEEGKNREFSPEPWAANGDLFDLPRNTSGYILTDAQRMSMLSLLHTNGVWNHFLHPDAVYPNAARYKALRAQGIEPPAEGFQWFGGADKNGLYYQLRTWLTFAREYYPWLRYMDASDAARTMKHYNQVEMRWASTGQALDIRADGATPETPLYLTVYSERDERITEINGGNFVYTGQQAFLNYHVVAMENDAMRVQFEAAPPIEEPPPPEEEEGLYEPTSASDTSAAPQNATAR